MADLPLIYGLQDLEEYKEVKVSEVGVNVVNAAIAEFMAYYQERSAAEQSAWVQRNEAWNTNPYMRWRLPYTMDFQRADTQTIAEPARAWANYDIGLPLIIRELANGYTWEAYKTRTVKQVSDWLWQITMADARFIRYYIKNTLLYNVGWTYNAPNEDFGVATPSAIPIKPLANNDSETYPSRGGQFNTAQHYTAQAAQVSDSADPFQTLYDKLNGYGFAYGSRRNIVAFVNGSALIAGIRGLAAFQPVTNYKYIIPSITQTQLSDSIMTQRYFGDEVLGEHESGMVIVKWEQMPDNYIAVMDMSRRAIGMREHVDPSLRGLYGIDTVAQYGNEFHERVRRMAGMAIVDRTAAAVHQVAAGDTTYDVPAGVAPLT